MKAIWSCIDCGREFEARWTGEAGMMAMNCIYCKKGIAISSYEHAVEDGCLIVGKGVECE